MALFLQLTQKLSQGFSAAWIRWPRKEAKKDAEKAWGQKVKTPETEEKIHGALDWQLPILEQREPQYIPLFATWLRGERWEDEPPTPAKPRAPVLSPRQASEVTRITDQLNKTEEVKRLMREEGLTREDASRRVFR